MPTLENELPKPNEVSCAKVDLTTKTLALLFTFELSLLDWKNSGLLSREVRYYKKWVDDGWKVIWITYGGKSDLQTSEDLGGIEVLPVYSVLKKSNSKILRLLQSFLLFYYLKPYIARHAVIKTNQMNGAWAAWGFKLFNKNKIIIRCGFQQLWTHFRETRGIYRRWIKSIMYFAIEAFSHTLADQIIYTSQSSIDFIKKTNFWISSKKIHLIPNFIDTKLFSTSELKDFSSKKALGVGRLNQVKRWPELFGSIQNKNWSIDVVGRGELETTLKNQVQDEGLPVMFLGVYSNDELADVYKKYSYFFLNSSFENNPKTLMEALSAGLICIAPDVVGINEIIDDGVNGFKVKKGESFENIISKIERTPQDELLKISKLARDYAIQNFDIQNAYSKEIKIMNGVLQ